MTSIIESQESIDTRESADTTVQISMVTRMKLQKIKERTGLPLSKIVGLAVFDLYDSVEKNQEIIFDLNKEI